MSSRLFEEYSSQLRLLYDALNTLRNLTQVYDIYSSFVTVPERLYKEMGEPKYEEKTFCNGFVYVVDCFGVDNRCDLRDACIKVISESIQTFQSTLMFEMSDIVHDYDNNSISAKTAMLKTEDIFVNILRIFTSTKKMFDLISNKSVVNIDTLDVMNLADKIEERNKKAQEEERKNKLLGI